MSSSKSCLSKDSVRACFRSKWPLILVFGVGVFFRFHGLTEWSLWEDEERTLYFSQHLDASFPASFPLYFEMLNGLFRLSGISVAVGRWCSALAGMTGVCLVYLCFRKWIGRGGAMLAAFLLAINFGHLFWSQSIRYYSMAFVFQLLCISCFLKGFEEDDLFSLFLSGAALVLALLTHSSSLLLVPVLVCYIFLTYCFKESMGRYAVRCYTAYGIYMLLVVGGFGYWRFVGIHNMISGWTVPSARDPIHIILSFNAFFGAPLIVIGMLAPFFVSVIQRRMIVFFVILSFLPLLELVVIAQMDVMDVAWYHVLFSLIGLVVLASVSIKSLYGLNHRFMLYVFAGGTLIYYLIFAAFYHTTLNGCRPPWREAAAYLQRSAVIDPNGDDGPEIYATAPAVVSYYLGAEPTNQMGYPLVRRVGFQPPEGVPVREQWILIRPNYITDEYARWFERHCILKKRFDSRIGPIDRWSVLVYHRPRLISSR